jgi:hypothetical protein
MSELSCFATLNLPGRARFGTVGTALPGIEVGLTDDGERRALQTKAFRGFGSGVWAALVNPHANIEGVRMLAVATN